jgi:hypothetical protein
MKRRIFTTLIAFVVTVAVSAAFDPELLDEAEKGDAEAQYLVGESYSLFP